MSSKLIIAPEPPHEQAQHRPRVPRRAWARLPREAILDASLSHLALRVLGLLNLFANKQGWAWPSTATISMLLGVSKASARRALAELTQKGYIVSSNQSGSPVRRRFLGKRQPLTPETRSSASDGRSYMSGEALTDERAPLTGERITIYRNHMHITKDDDERSGPPATSDTGDMLQGEHPLHPPGEGARGREGLPSPSPKALGGAQGTHHPTRAPLERLEAAVAAAGDPDPDDESAVPFSTRARLAARLRAAALGLVRHLEGVDGLLYALSIAVLGWPTLPDEGKGWDEGEEPEERLRRWVDETSKRARYSTEELAAAGEEFYTLARAARFLIACAAFICSQRPILTPGSNCAEAIKRLAWEAAGEAERLTGIQPRESWSDACHQLAQTLLTTQRVRRREGSITLHRWRISPRLTGDELAQLLPEASAFVTALQSNGHQPETSGGE